MRSGKGGVLATNSDYTTAPDWSAPVLGFVWQARPAVIVFDRVSVSYEGARVLRELSLKVSEGELLIMLGPSGGGKSTALKTINRLVTPTHGSVSVDGKDVSKSDPIALRRSIGYVFQRFGLFPHRSIFDNVATVPRLLEWKEPAIAERVEELLKLVSLEPDRYAQRLPAELSGGQQQRVGVARALAARPRIMLMDEPFGALDPVTRASLQIEYQRIHRELELTTILVTHDVSEALLMGDRIAVLDHGRIVQVDTPERLVREPANDQVADLIRTPLKHLEQLEALRGAT